MLDCLECASGIVCSIILEIQTKTFKDGGQVKVELFLIKYFHLRCKSVNSLLKQLSKVSVCFSL